MTILSAPPPTSDLISFLVSLLSAALGVGCMLRCVPAGLPLEFGILVLEVLLP